MTTDTRIRRAKKNIFVSLGCQLITLLCGVIVPKLMIGAYGSEVYGATVSIAQFLSYIALLEGGVGGVARAVLYKPLAEKNLDTLGRVMAEIRRFFKIIAFIFLAYVLVIACSFRAISQTEILDFSSSFLLVIAISISIFGQYFIGISHTILLQAAQKSYVTNAVNIAGMVINTLLVIVLVSLGSSIITVKLVSSLIFAIKPFVLRAYVQRHYRMKNESASQTKYLTQKWSGLSQHIAFFLHSNTDIVVLTFFSNLKSVAVYSVYNMVVVNIQNLATSFVSGMEALFGDMLAKKEDEKLRKTFNTYETLISAAAILLFSVTAVMIVPFVRIYTAGVTDVSYDAPVFSLLLTLSAFMYCLRMPWHSVIIAAGHFRQTQLAAYGEATINVGLSILLVSRFGLTGVAIGTLTATSFRLIYYAVYLSRRILHRPIILFVRQMLLNAALFFLIVWLGGKLTAILTMENYGMWAVYSALAACIALIVTAAGQLLFNRQNCKALLGKNA